MWYRWAKDSIGFQRIASRVMTRVAASMSELWKNLEGTGITNDLGMRDPRDLQRFLGQQGQGGLEQIGGAAANIPDDQARQQLQGSMQNYMAGRLLGEEIARVRQQAAAEGRPPSVAEMRAARRKANERLMAEGSAEWMGMPQQFQTGSRGPLAKNPKLTQITLPKSPLVDDKLSQIASDIYSKEVMTAKMEAQRRYDEGQSDTYEPKASDLRAAIKRTNDALTEMGYPWVQLHVGTRGPLAKSGPGYVEVVEQPNQFWAKEKHRRRNDELAQEREKARRKRENLGLDPALDIGMGKDDEGRDVPNIVVPSPEQLSGDEAIPEEVAIADREEDKLSSIIKRKRLQEQYRPQPPYMHDDPPGEPPTCRCQILDLPGGQIWKTVGDERVCQRCQYHSQIFNSLGQQAPNTPLPPDQEHLAMVKQVIGDVGRKG